MQGSSRSISRRFIGYLTVVSLLGIAEVYLATYRFGAGVSTDAVMNMAAASNLLAGRGLIDIYHQPLVQWPPLYALILAGLSGLTRADVFVAGWHLNALVFGACIFSSGILVRRTFPHNPLYAYIGAAIVATSLGVIQISANIASDPLLLLFTILYLIFAGRYAERRSPSDLLAAGSLACLASFQRYAGLTLVVAGALLLAILHRRQPWRALAAGAVFFALAGGPVLLWGLLHNRPVTGTLFGSNVLSPNAFGNLRAASEKLLYWFIPYNLIEALTPYAMLGVVIAALLLMNRGPRWKNWWHLITSEAQLGSTIFLALYAGMLVFYVSYEEHRNLESQRIHMIIMPSLLLLLFSTVRELVPPRPGSAGVRWKDLAGAILALLWLVYPVSKVWEYEQKSDGVESSGTNLYNTAAIHEGKFLDFLQALPTSEAALYSNYEAAAWFYLRCDIGSLPRTNENGDLDRRSQGMLRTVLTSGRETYLVWFNTIHIRNNPGLTPVDAAQVRQVVDLKPLWVSPAGDIYLVMPPFP